MLFGAATPFLFGIPIPVLASTLGTGLMFGVTGFVLGFSFSGLLKLAEGRRRFDELSVPRFGAWGTLAGAAIGILATGGNLWRAGDPLWVDALLSAITALLGGASAMGTLWIARQGEDQALLDDANGVRKIGLTEEE